jgi:hypothetical protein
MFLQNLRYNVKQNTTKSDDVLSLEGRTLSIVDMGKIFEPFLERHGPQDVILASDCVYMIPSLEPLCQSVYRLLMKTKDGGIFL